LYIFIVLTPPNWRDKNTIKCALGSLEFEEALESLIPSELVKNQIEIMPIQNEEAILAGQLSMHHKDPFDRMLIAQANIESMGIITNDLEFKLYEADIYW